LLNVHVSGLAVESKATLVITLTEEVVPHRKGIAIARIRVQSAHVIRESEAIARVIVVGIKIELRQEAAKSVSAMPQGCEASVFERQGTRTEPPLVRILKR
jgi:hypothetical protein